MEQVKSSALSIECMHCQPVHRALCGICREILPLMDADKPEFMYSHLLLTVVPREIQLLVGF